jgi:hypothetical protein
VKRLQLAETQLAETEFAETEFAETSRAQHAPLGPSVPSHGDRGVEHVKS